jgi:hypothetical protein
MLMASGMNSGHRRRSIVMVAAVMTIVASLVAGCGGNDFIYVANSDEKTYFRIPSEWKQVDQTPIDDYFMAENPDSAVGQIRKQLQWSVAYDADVEPTPRHMTSSLSNDAPILYATVRHLPEPEQNRVSYDFLRDIFTPIVTTASRNAMQQAGYDLSSFELLLDEILPTSEGGLRGVRVIFNFDVGGVIHTFDQTTLASADSSILYLLLIRCTAKCYRERAVEIDDIATSFTVRSSP